MSVKIPLTNSKLTFLVDDEDAPRVLLHNWYLRAGYICRTDTRMPITRFLLNPEPELVVDHISGNRRDNTKANLRICTKNQNWFNAKSHKNSRSKYKGVTWDIKAKKWAAQIQYSKQHKFIGYFNTELEAAKAYNDNAVLLFKEYAKLNELN